MLVFILFLSLLHATTDCSLNKQQYSTPPPYVPAFITSHPAFQTPTVTRKCSPLNESFRLEESAITASPSHVSSDSTTSPFQIFAVEQAALQDRTDLLKAEVAALEDAKARLKAEENRMLRYLIALIIQTNTTERDLISREENSVRQALKEASFTPHDRILQTRRALAYNLRHENPCCNDFATFRCPVTNRVFDLDTGYSDTE